MCVYVYVRKGREMWRYIHTPKPKKNKKEHMYINIKLQNAKEHALFLPA
jgi:hypothetical protein